MSANVFESEIDGLTKGDTGWVSIQFAPLGDAYLDYVFELETSESDR